MTKETTKLHKVTVIDRAGDREADIKDGVKKVLIENHDGADYIKLRKTGCPSWINDATDYVASKDTSLQGGLTGKVWQVEKHTTMMGTFVRLYLQPP